MAVKRIPDDAFEQYLAMPDRSHEKLAERLGVSKRAITRRAKRDKWAERLAEHEQAEREATNQHAVESLGAVTARQLRILRAIQGKALSRLHESTLTSALDAVKALELSFKQERALAGATPREEQPEQSGFAP